MATTGEPAAPAAGKAAAKMAASAETSTTAGESAAKAAASAEAPPAAGEPAAERTASTEAAAATESAGTAAGRTGPGACSRPSGRAGRSGRAGTAGTPPENRIIHHRRNPHSRPQITPPVAGPSHAVQNDPRRQQNHQQRRQIQHQHIQRRREVAIGLRVVSAAVGVSRMVTS